MSYPYLIQGKNIVIVIDNKIHTINDTHISYTKIIECIKSNDWVSIKGLVDPVSAIIQYSKGNVSIIDNVVYWNGQEFKGAMSTRIVEMFKEGFDIAPMVSFMSNLMSNPSKTAIEQLYEFLERCNLPITPDGCFLAYKRVKADYMDVYSGTMNNSVGNTVSMPRCDVDTDAEKTCSHGLHFCSHDYLQHFSGDRVMILKVNPADVVSIPVDYQFTKGRCWKYEVIGEVVGNTKDAFDKPVMENAVGNEVSAPVEKVRVLSMTPNAIRKRAAKAAKDAGAPKPTKVLSMTPNAIRKRKAREMMV